MYPTSLPDDVKGRGFRASNGEFGILPCGYLSIECQVLSPTLIFLGAFMLLTQTWKRPELSRFATEADLPEHFERRATPKQLEELKLWQSSHKRIQTPLHR